MRLGCLIFAWFLGGSRCRDGLKSKNAYLKISYYFQIFNWRARKDSNL